MKGAVDDEHLIRAVIGDLEGVGQPPAQGGIHAHAVDDQIGIHRLPVHHKSADAPGAEERRSDPRAEDDLRHLGGAAVQNTVERTALDG